MITEPVIGKDATPAPARKAQYRPDIDGLRAVAVSAVVAFHAGARGVTGGYVGVDIFFVISGYLIGGIVLRELSEQRFSFARFYSRRAKRILPALFLILAFCYVGAVVFLSPIETRFFSRDALATVFSISNVSLYKAVNYFSPAADLNPLLMTWSLGVEEQFYLVCPVLLLWLFRSSRSSLFPMVGALSVLSLSLCIWSTLRYPAAAFFLLPARAWELGLGILIAIRELQTSGKADASTSTRRHDVMGVAGLGLILCSVFVFSGSTPFPGVAALAPVVGAALIVAAPKGVINRRVLSNKILVGIGLISYSWYLWHWPLLSFARIVLGDQLRGMVAASVAALSILMAFVSWKWVEQPIRHWRATSSFVLRFSACSILLAAAPAVLLYASNGWAARFPGLKDPEKGAAAFAHAPCLVNYGNRPLRLSPFCEPESNPGPAVALLGDSHAAALAPALRELSAEEGYKMYELAKVSCPALAGVSPIAHSHPSHRAECGEFMSQAIDYVRRRPDIEVVVLAGFWGAPFMGEKQGDRYVQIGQSDNVSPGASESNLKLGLGSLIALLTASGKRVIVAKDVPMFEFDPMQRARTQAIGARLALVQLLSPQPANYEFPLSSNAIIDQRRAQRIVDEVLASNKSAETLDLRKAFCAGDACSYRTASTLLFVDSQHLSPDGARRALSGFRL